MTLDQGSQALPFTIAAGHLLGVTGSGNWAKHNNPAQCVPGYLRGTTGKPKK